MTVFQKATTSHQAGSWTEPTPSAMPRELYLWCPRCKAPLPLLRLSPETVDLDSTGQSGVLKEPIACATGCGFSENAAQITGL